MAGGIALDTEILERLIDHEIAYLGFAAQVERRPNAVLLHAPALPEYRDANSAYRLRCPDRSPDTLVEEIAAYYRERGLAPAVALDPIAVSQGIPDALVRHGLRQVAGDRILMRYARPDSLGPSDPSAQDVTVERVPTETGRGQASEWIETAVADDLGWPDELLWRGVASLEARCVDCVLYLARIDGRPAGACDLFCAAGWARLDSVVTRPEMRRRGVATALVTRAVHDALTSGNNETYLFTEPESPAERLYRRLGFETWHPNPFQSYRA